MSKNSGASSSSRVLSSIPSNVRKTIEHIKEITSNHSEEDIYAMLKDCSMDPNETTQRLLLLDTFHEVKRKRDKKKEAVKSRSGEESRWQSGHQGRGTRSARGNSFSHYTSNDANARKIAPIRKENGMEESREKGPRHSHALVSKEMDSIQSRDRERSSSIITNGPIELSNGSLSGDHGVKLSKMGGVHLSEKNADVSADNVSSIMPKASVEIAPSASDPVLVPPCDSWGSAVGSTKQEVRVQQTDETSSLVLSTEEIDSTELPRGHHLNRHEVESIDDSHLSSSTSEEHLFELLKVVHPKISGECPEADKSHGPDSTFVKPSSPQGVRDATAKLENLKFSHGQHVIIPQHIQVPDEVKNVLSFGSLDASFGVRENYVNNESNETSNHVVNSAHEEHEETVSKNFSCDQDNASQANHADHPQSPLHLPGQNYTEVSSSATVPEDDQPKEENLPAIGPPFPVAQTTPSYGFGFMPPMLASMLARPEGVESQAPAVSSLDETSASTSTSTPPPAGAGQSSIGVSPLPIHVFRQHYPPNYVPYNHYFSPYYVPPTMHQYFGHTAFPSPLPAASMYLPPPTTAPGIKIAPANFKSGAHTGNQVPLGMPPVYGAYSTTPVSYIQNATVASGISNNAEDLGPPALKESNIYLGQQSEGSAVWLPAAGGREATSFPLNSFLNLPPHGQQHMINPQSGHGGFTVYHTLQPMGSPAPGLPLSQQSQPVAGSMESVGPPSISYQQPQLQQPITWSM